MTITMTDVLNALGITQYTLVGNPLTEELFNQSFKKVESLDADGNPTFTNDWGFTWSEVKAKYDEMCMQEVLNSCKQTAKSLLADSDWSVLPDVGLKNSDAYITYRGILRGYALQPVVDPQWPTKPTPVWQ
jgi:hypothetical protein